MVDLEDGSKEKAVETRCLPVLQGRQNSRDSFVWHVSADGIFDLELLLLLVESPADDVKINGLNDKIL